MMRFSTLGLGAALLAAATPAFAQDAPEEPTPAITVTGGVTLLTDYRFRGATQTDEKPAVQGTVNINHESGLYAGVFASSIDGGTDGSTPALTGYGSVEIDLYGGYTKTLDSGFGFDAGLLYYLYADHTAGLNTDFFEPYASVNYTVGPANIKVGAAYAWGGQDGLNFTAGDDENTYIYSDLAFGIPKTPITLKGHIGFTNGSLGLLNPTAADDSYTDWSLTAEVVKGPFKAGVTYVDTDISNVGSFAQNLGRGSGVFGYVGVSF